MAEGVVIATLNDINVQHDVINQNTIELIQENDSNEVASGTKLKASPSDLANNNQSGRVCHMTPDEVDFDDDFDALENDILEHYLPLVNDNKQPESNYHDVNTCTSGSDAIEEYSSSTANQCARIDYTAANRQEVFHDDTSLENDIVNEILGDERFDETQDSTHKYLSEEDIRIQTFLNSSPDVTSDILILTPRAVPVQFAALTMNLSFAGCGFLGIYHLGVAHSLVHHGQKLLLNVQRFGGASAGSLIASALAIRGSDKQVIEECVNFCYDLADTVRHKRMGMLTPRLSLLEPLNTFLDKFLPEDAHIIAKNKLFISVTDVRTRKNHLICDFESKAQLIQYLLGSSYVPFMTGTKPVKIGTQKYMDGGMTDNLPEIPHGRTILISPFSGRQHISPQDKSGRGRFVHIKGEDFQVTVNNLKRGLHAFSPPKRKYMERYFERGKEDCIRFLKMEHFYEAVIQNDVSDVPRAGHVSNDDISETSFSQSNTVDTEVDDIQVDVQDKNRHRGDGYKHT